MEEGGGWSTCVVTYSFNLLNNPTTVLLNWLKLEYYNDRLAIFQLINCLHNTPVAQKAKLCFKLLLLQRLDENLKQKHFQNPYKESFNWRGAHMKNLFVLMLFLLFLFFMCVVFSTHIKNKVIFSRLFWMCSWRLVLHGRQWKDRYR